MAFLLGVSKTTNVLEETMKAFTNVSTDIINQTNVKTDTSQLISVVGGTGDLLIDGTVQRINVRINAQSLLKAITSTEGQQKLASQLEQTAKSANTGLNLGQLAIANNTTRHYMESVLNIATSVSQLCGTESRQSQAISVEHRNGNIIISNVLQETVLDLLSSCLQDSITQSSAITAMQSLITQSATAENQGLSDWAIVALAGIALLAVVLPIAIPLAIGISAIMRNLFIILGAALLLAGIGLLVAYFLTQKTQMATVAWTPGIDRTQAACNAQGSSKSTEFAAPEDAGAKCLSDPGCQAYDWIGWDTSVPGQVNAIEPSTPRPTPRSVLPPLPRRFRPNRTSSGGANGAPGPASRSTSRTRTRTAMRMWTSTPVTTTFSRKSMAGTQRLRARF
jgi:hypothetical protein